MIHDPKCLGEPCICPTISVVRQEVRQEERGACVQRVIDAALDGKGMWANIPAVWTAEIIATVEGSGS
jgi:hypothetical protein